MVENFITYSHLDLKHFKSNDVFKPQKAFGLEGSRARSRAYYPTSILELLYRLKISFCVR